MVTELDEHFDQVSEEDYHFVAQLIAKEVYARLKREDFSRKAGTRTSCRSCSTAALSTAATSSTGCV